MLELFLNKNFSFSLFNKIKEKEKELRQKLIPVRIRLNHKNTKEPIISKINFTYIIYISKEEHLEKLEEKIKKFNEEIKEKDEEIKKYIFSKIGEAMMEKYKNLEKDEKKINELFNLIKEDKEDEEKIKRIREILGRGDGGEGRLRKVCMLEEEMKIIRKVNISNLEKIKKEISLREGKRINRKFLSGLDYRPLVLKTKEKKNKDKILILIDASGSMWSSISKATQFAYNIWMSIKEKYKISGIIYYNENGYYDVVGDWSKGIYKRMEEDGDEGFENLPFLLFEYNFNKVIVLTDMIISNKEREGLKRFFKGKKHLIFSFKRDAKDFNVFLVNNSNVNIMLQKAEKFFNT